VKPSEGENVTKNKNGKILNQGLHQRSKTSALRHGKTYQCRGLTVALTKLSVFRTYKSKCKKYNILFH